MVGLPASIIKQYGVTKKAWSVFRGRHKSRSHPARVRHHSTKRRMYSMARRRRLKHGHRGSLMQAAEKLVKAGALVGPAVVDLYTYRNTPDHGAWAILADYSGFDVNDRSWHPSYLLRGWGPVAGVTIASKLYHKINGLLRHI